MSSVVQLHGDAAVDVAPQIPAGTYQAYYLHHKTAFMFNSGKVFVHFRIYGGEYDGTRLYRAYRVKAIKGRPRKFGSFKLGHTHELYRQFVRMSGTKERADRISLSRLKSCLLRVSVRTVTKDSKQRDLPEALQYSVVDEMQAIEAGDMQ